MNIVLHPGAAGLRLCLSVKLKSFLFLFEMFFWPKRVAEETNLGLFVHSMLLAAAYCCLLLFTAVYCFLLFLTATYCCLLLLTAAYCYLLLLTAVYCC